MPWDVGMLALVDDDLAAMDLSLLVPVDDGDDVVLVDVVSRVPVNESLLSAARPYT